MTQSPTDKLIADNLLPCPFCGGEPQIALAEIQEPHNDIMVKIWCDKCYRAKVRCLTEERFCNRVHLRFAAIKQWNTRHNPDAEKLKVAVKALQDISAHDMGFGEDKNRASHVLAEINKIAENKREWLDGDTSKKPIVTVEDV